MLSGHPDNEPLKEANAYLGQISFVSSLSFPQSSGV